MWHPRPFALVLAGAALCSAGGLLVSQMPTSAAEVEHLAPTISAFPTESAAPSNVPPTVVTQVTPLIFEDPEPSPAASPTALAPTAVATLEVADVAATPTPATEALTAAPVSTGVSLPVPVRISAIENLPEKANGLLAAMNGARLTDGQSELQWDDALASVALSRARDLVEQGYFAHYGPDGGSAFSELAARGINYALAGENLARNNYLESKTVAAAFDGLMASPGHRANILEPRFTRVGVAAVQDGRMWVYVTVFMS